MKTQSFMMKKTVIAGATALTLLSAPLLMASPSIIATTGASFISIALAASGDGSGEGHKGAGAGDSKQGGQADGTMGSGGKKGMDKVLEEGDDSDRPAWAGGDPTANPHSGGGEGKPAGAGTKKGDDYGDLIVLLRNPITGEPIIDADGEFAICLDVACTSTVASVDGEVPAGVTPLEVDFGRSAVARSPSKVSDKSLADALAKLTVDGAVISQDASGRIVVTVDGISSTIDSPLENLALYIDLMTGLASSATSSTETALGTLATLETAASLLAAVGDKTGDISIDYVVYENVIAGVVDSGDYYSFTDFTSYTRSYPTDYSYFYTLDGGTTVLSAVLNINTYLTEINGALPTSGGAILFAAAADDAVEVIELLHTQIYSEILPGTVTTP
jgi:hypothetical protein